MHRSWARRAALGVIVTALVPAGAGAQAPAPVPAPVPAEPAAASPARRNVVAVNPLAAAFGLWAGEYERVVTPQLGVSVGAGHWSLFGGTALRYDSADLRLRWYAREGAPAGVSFGVLGGVTRVSSGALDHAVTAVGTGVEVNYGELAGADDRLYLGVGVGMKRLFPVRGAPQEIRVGYPTARVAVGWSF